VRGVFQPQPKEANKDDKAGKDGKAPTAPPKPNPPAPLKADDALSPGSAK
jgi:hypothetical protein